MKIAIIGAGVCGLTSATKIAEFFENNPNVTVTLFSEEVSPNTTGDGSAGLWGPYICGDTPVKSILKWAKESHDFFLEMWRNGQAEEIGISLLPVIRVTKDKEGYVEPDWKDIVFGCTKLTEKDIERLNKEHNQNYTGGYEHVTFACEPTRFLPYLFKRFKIAGGKFINKKINNFDELEMFDIIVNCTGLGSRFLVNDELVRPVRGQIARVEAPWMYHAILDDSNGDGNYIIPNINYVILGGTHQLDDYNRNLSQDDRNFILNGCAQTVPSLKNAKLHKEWVGLRPGRREIRLEQDIHQHKSGKLTNVIHNYGHGGCGVTLSWGCASDVLNLVKSNIYSLSKL